MPPRPGLEQLPFDAGNDVRERVAELELLPPKEIDSRLTDMGYRGQEEARRAASVLAYRHVRRIRRLYLEGLAPEGHSRGELPLPGPHRQREDVPGGAALPRDSLRAHGDGGRHPVLRDGLRGR